MKQMKRLTAIANHFVKAAALGLCCVSWAMAQDSVTKNVAEVEYARGVGFAQSGQQTPRAMGKGLTLQEGDRITTADQSTAILKFTDGSRLTVRPNSEIVVKQFQYRENASSNNMLLEMLRGGLRAITGLIAKGSPNAARIQTNTATIGIRGTDFDARLCAKDCHAEANQIEAVARPNTPQASARVLVANGDLSATDSQGTKRRMVSGASIYPGDLLETARGSHAVIAFRDDSRMTLGSATRFKVEQFVYDVKNPNEGKFLVSLVRGTLRALTGLIGKANPQNVRFTTPTATIGVRGSGSDISYHDSCQGEPASCVTGLSVYVWLGSFIVDAQGRTAIEVLLSGEGLHISGAELRRFTDAPDPRIPRPDAVPTPGNLFNNEKGEPDEGLYLFVRDGHIEIATDKEVLHLGRGEAGVVGADGLSRRPEYIPKFLDYDRIPLPNARNPAILDVLTSAGVKAPPICR